MKKYRILTLEQHDIECEYRLTADSPKDAMARIRNREVKAQRIRPAGTSKLIGEIELEEVK